MTKATNTAKNVNTARAAKPARTPRAAKPAPIEVQFINVIRDACEARITVLNGLEGKAGQVTELRAAQQFASDNAMRTAYDVMTQTDWSKVARVCGTVNELGKGIEQTKSVVKIARTIGAIASGLRSALDKNSSEAIDALLRMQNHATVRELAFSQSRAATRTGDTFNVRTELFKCTANYSAGTASAQVSQVRQVLNTLGFFSDFTKGKTNDDAKLNEYGLTMLARLA